MKEGIGNPSEQTRREASIEALRSLYRIVVALAIVEALRRALTVDGQFLHDRIIHHPHLTSTVLLLTFLPTVVRFFHGASIHLSSNAEPCFKPAIDFAGFFVQALLFYILALTVDQPKSFMVVLGVLILADTVWLVVLLAMKHVEPDPTIRQWLISNVLILVTLLLLQMYRASLADYQMAYGLFSVAWVAAVADYLFNRHFYFPKHHESSAK